MEEDIKILKKYLDEEKGAFNIWKIETINECEDLRIAIENLRARNKELEREKLSKSGIYKFDVNIENCIPKSKIKEKIEELNNNYLVVAMAQDEIIAIQHNHDIDIKIHVLQELLEPNDNHIPHID